MKIVCISDTHAHHGQMTLPEGDLLLHAGDFTKRGRASEISDFNAWLGKLPHRHKVVIAGNHDFLFEKNPAEARSLITNAIYLQDSCTEINGYRIWGSPWQPWFFNWAFNLPRGPEIAQKWALIPTRIDILLTHGPPYGVLDRTARESHVGCEALMQALSRIQPQLHVFGHIHEAYGQAQLENIHFVNASSCNLEYAPVHPPAIITLPDR